MTQARAVVVTLLAALVVAVPSANASLRGCGVRGGFIVNANSHTSCAFALATASAVGRGDLDPFVFSPVTGRTYHMFCHRIGFTSRARYHCVGGNDALVELRR